jgi:anti-sigma factor RsiW
METDGMRYLDGEMPERERADFERHVEACESCRESLRGFKELESVTRRITMKDPADEFWEKYWKSIYRRVERKTAWIFIIAGTIMLVGFTLYQSIRSFGEITFEKFALVVFIIGAVLLLLSVIRERYHQYKTDRYKDIQR